MLAFVILNSVIQFCNKPSNSQQILRDEMLHGKVTLWMNLESNSLLHKSDGDDDDNNDNDDDDDDYDDDDDDDDKN